jgi:hypothetical protein
MLVGCCLARWKPCISLDDSRFRQWFGMVQMLCYHAFPLPFTMKQSAPRSCVAQRPSWGSVWPSTRQGSRKQPRGSWLAETASIIRKMLSCPRAVSDLAMRSRTDSLSHCLHVANQNKLGHAPPVEGVRSPAGSSQSGVLVLWCVWILHCLPCIHGVRGRMSQAPDRAGHKCKIEPNRAARHGGLA